MLPTSSTENHLPVNINPSMKDHFIAVSHISDGLPEKLTEKNSDWVKKLETCTKVPVKAKGKQVQIPPDGSKRSTGVNKGLHSGH